MSTHDQPMWQVIFSRKVGKQQKMLPPRMVDALLLLVEELARRGPVVPKWHHYGKLYGKKDTYHCHLNKGKPRYVVVWFVYENQIKIMEVTYVGTHENAPY